MQRRIVLMSSLVLLLALTMCETSGFSMRTTDKRIPGFHAVKRLPETMVAGSTYECEVTFVNPKSEEGSINVTLEITEEKTLIGSGEFSVEGTLESYDDPPRPHDISALIFTEIEGGIFQSQIQIEKRFNRITLKITSVPNLMPGTYTFTLIVAL